MTTEKRKPREFTLVMRDVSDRKYLKQCHVYQGTVPEDRRADLEQRGWEIVHVVEVLEDGDGRA